MENSSLLIILSSLISGLIGVIISSIFYRNLEKQKNKVDTAKRLIGNRYNLRGDEFSTALNEVVVVFANDAKVIKALENLLSIAMLGQRNSEDMDDKLLKLIKEICKSIKHFPKELNDTFFLKAFNNKS